jgi:hypothetical protein
VRSVTKKQIIIFDKISQLKKIVLFIAYCLPLVSYSQQNYWQQQVNYTIDVSLNDIEHTLDGFEKIQYLNNSPDTLHFIWFHVWPNAYKNDRTAFSEQLLQNGKTKFYFSDKEDHGYINHLDFRVNGVEATMEDHPLYIDVIKIILPQPLPPGDQIEITTPFHEKLPFNFSRGGHVGRSYQITQWYPKPAVYDAEGWHDMPYLDQGEFFSEFGNFNVKITLPKNYIVAATGELQNEEEKSWLINNRQDTRDKGQETRIKAQENKKQVTSNKLKTPRNKIQNSKLKTQNLFSETDKETKTLIYKQNNVHDFAWFADKRFIVNHDTLQLRSGRIIDCYSFYLPGENSPWKKSISFIKDAIRFHSDLIGEYPYNIATAVEAKMGIDGGMEYPTITSISSSTGERELDFVISHELGHNWFYGILASNERRYPWMDEGMNTYYDNRYAAWKYPDHQGAISIDAKGIQNKIPDNIEELLVTDLEKKKTDQPISTSSENFTSINYNMIAYAKTGLWMKKLETDLGKKLFDSCMREYFLQWQFKHPYPENFKAVIEKASGKKMDDEFILLDKKGPLTSFNEHKKIKPTLFFNERNTDKFNYINFSPAIGSNAYDKFMIGAMMSNFHLPPNNFEFVLIPLYATGSKQFNGIGRLSYTWRPDNYFQKIELATDVSKFSSLSGIDSNGNKIFGGFYKIAPSIRFTLKNKNARSTIEKWAEFKTYIIGEKAFNYVMRSTDSNYYPTTQKYVSRYLNQLTFNIEDYRVLYPYNVQLQVQQGSEFYKLNFTTNYFFNYSKGGGFNVRFFAAKFGYIGAKNSSKEFETEVYQPKLTATRGDEDYTYSNYFIGRNESTGFASQQIMIKDGGLKLRTDIFSYLQGRSDNWIASMNFNTTLPTSIIPKQIPLKIFLDVGTYADAWSNAPPTSKFLYVGGLQLSLFKDLINIYAPLLYSSDFRNNLKSVPEENTFLKKISFSIDIQNFNFKRIFGNIPL